MMKYSGLILIILCLLVAADTPRIDMQTDELVKLATLMTDSNLNVNEWTVTIKEKIPDEQRAEFIHILKKDHQWTTKKNDNTTKFIARSTDHDEDISITYQILTPKEKQYKTELIVTMSGASWSESVGKHYLENIEKISSNYFTEIASTYTCLSTRNDAIINSDRIIDTFVQELDLKYVSTQNDTMKQITSKKIIYGYTDLWTNEIVMDGSPLNIQMVINHTENEKEKIMIGTPILINEY